MSGLSLRTLRGFFAAFAVKDFDRKVRQGRKENLDPHKL
jgi:hypothetical protein